MFIAEVGSGNGNGNSIEYQKEIIDSIAENKNDRTVVIKYQLFQDAPPNKPLKRAVFEKCFNYAKRKNIQVTASVFDIDSLRFLQEFDIPFIKIANNPKYYPLARGIKTPLVISYSSVDEMGKRKDITPLCCVSRYPAQAIQYEKNFTSYWLTQGISDHTEGFDLYHKYQPEVWEKHYCLKHDKNNPDAGVFAMTPDDWGEM